MRKFISKNKAISILFCLSVFVIISYIISLEKEEWFPHAGEWFIVLFQLAIGFIINVIFYVTQVYIPHRKHIKETNRCICSRINSIVSLMRSILSQLGVLYVGYYDESKVDKKYFLTILQRLNTGDQIGVINAEKVSGKPITENERFSVKEWLNSCIFQIEKEIDKLFTYYGAYINLELMKTLEEILKSFMHTCMYKINCRLNCDVSYKDYNVDTFFKPYYDLMKLLEDIEKEYK